MTKKKLLFFVIIIIVTLFATTLISNAHSFTEITTACVDQYDGDVAFAFHSGNGVYVKSYNKHGDLLFSEYYNSDGGSAIYMEYIDSNLCIYIARTNEVLIYDDDMNYVSKDGQPDLYNFFIASLERTNWDGWISSWNSKKYSANDLDYCYEKSSLFLRILKKGECKLYILTQNNEQIILYHSTSK